MLRLFLAFVALALLAAAPASAQLVDLTISSPTQEAKLGPNESKEIHWTVSNNGPADGQVTLTPPALAGWKVELTQGQWSFTLESGTPYAITTKVSPEAGQVPRNGTLQLAGRITGPGNTQEDANEQVSLFFVAPPVVSPPPPPVPKTSVLPWVGFGAGVVAALGVGILVSQSRRVRIDVDNLRERVNRGTDAVYAVQVENRAPWSQTIRLRLRNMPQGWYGALSTSRILLAPRESARIPILIKVPSSATLGPGNKLKLHATANRFIPWAVKRQLAMDVVDLRPFDAARVESEPKESPEPDAPASAGNGALTIGAN